MGPHHAPHQLFQSQSNTECRALNFQFDRGIPHLVLITCSWPTTTITTTSSSSYAYGPQERSANSPKMNGSCFAPFNWKNMSCVFRQHCHLVKLHCRTRQTHWHGDASLGQCKVIFKSSKMCLFSSGDRFPQSPYFWPWDWTKFFEGWKILNWPVLHSATDVHSYLRLIHYISVFLPKLADHTAVLTPLTTKDAHKHFPLWTEEHQCAFEAIKALVVSAECLTVINHNTPSDNKISSLAMQVIGVVGPYLALDQPGELVDPSHMIPCNWKVPRKTTWYIIGLNHNWVGLAWGLTRDVCLIGE